MNTDIFQELGIGTRLRRFMDILGRDADRLYSDAGLPFKAGYFYVMYALDRKGSMPITEISRLAGFSHSAVSQTVKKMMQENILESYATDDGRQKLITLTEKGKELRSAMTPLWQGVDGAVKALIKESGTDFLGAMTTMEISLAKRSFYERVTDYLNPVKDTLPYEIIPFHVQHRKAFHDLNISWLEEFFTVEPIDTAVLNNPEDYILSKGGEIFYAVQGGRAVGTVALKSDTQGRYELTKLGVDKSARKEGIGAALCKTVIERFEARGGTTLFLETNTKLENAIRLYKTLNFIEKPNPHSSPYERANYYMEWNPPS